MFDIGFSELLVVGVVSLIVVGPKDLPGMFRTVGKYVGKAKSMAREFQRSMEDAADATGLKDVTSDFKDITSSFDEGRELLKPGPAGVKKAKEKFDRIMEAKESGVPLDDKPEDLAEPEVASTPIIDIVEDEAPVVEPDAPVAKD